MDTSELKSIEADLERLLGADAIRRGAGAADYLHDSTEMQGLRGHADAVVAPSSVDDVRQLVRWCSERGVAMVPRGGGTGFAGGAVPSGGVVVSMERLDRVRSFEPEYWRIHVDAGLTTGRLHRIARESGLLFPPDPGASEQSQVGGNIACNAGGPHSFKYGVTRDWVTEIEVVVDGGELVTLGSQARKDVAGYDLRGLFIGSEGTLGIITGARLRLIPAPEATIALVVAYSSVAAGVAGLERVYGFGIRAAVLEYLDSGAVEASRAAFPGGLPEATGFLVIAEADGSEAEAATMVAALEDALGPGALMVRPVTSAAEQGGLWRWRSGVSFAVRNQRGGKMSEDIAVPFDRLREAIELGERVGRQAGLATCSWGHAGDGNLHATFMIDATSADEVRSASEAAELLFAGAIALGGSVSGEHGLGLVKRHQLERQVGPTVMRLQRAVKAAFDPRNLFNPGKKVVLAAIAPGGVEATPR